jgi:hypothetical protein
MFGELEQSGAAVFRRALVADDVARLRRRTERAFHLASLQWRVGIASKSLRSTLPWGGMAGATMRRYVGRGLYDSVAEHARLAASDALLSRTRLIPALCLFRNHDGKRTHIAWHADADAAGGAEHDPCFNVWVPLVPVGKDRPSLQFVLGSHRVMRGLPLRDPQASSLTEEWVKDNLPGDAWTPIMEPGDVVIFDHYTVHRTQPMTHTEPRYSAEFRVTLKP